MKKVVKLLVELADAMLTIGLWAFLAGLAACMCVKCFQLGWSLLL